MNQISNSKRPWVVLLGTLVAQLVLGSIYTWSLFNQPLVTQFGWPLGKVALTFAFTTVFLALGASASGPLERKFGIRKTVIGSAILLVAGLFLASRVSSLWQLYLTAGVMVGFANGVSYMLTLSNMIRWMPERKGLISGLSISAYGLGSFVFKYVNVALLHEFGVSSAFAFWGILISVLLIGITPLLTSAPQDTAGAPAKTGYSLREVLRMPQAYLIFVMLFTTCMGGLYSISIATDVGIRLVDLTAAEAAEAVSIMALANIAGRLILGPGSDHVGRKPAIALALVLMLSGVCLLLFAPLSKPIFLVSMAAITFSFGGCLTVYPAMVGDYFGVKNVTQIYGLVYQGFGLSALTGALIGILGGGLQGTFFAIIALCAVSLSIVLFIRPPRPASAPLQAAGGQA
ncbi:OFA family MFS transporter [Paraburkholderia dinghuensis]|uniref:MFS transporter n=1 Tax=Paraburkholderia dinghuensis TaxID=2305225 RepID=A0A3N6MHL5_9BURK|nr:OFA family MFS transporter [Paraburkholderia dinghuensis]RQH00595.1 MFS transporter [Paraburkholderia dinghuensis]